MYGVDRKTEIVKSINVLRARTENAKKNLPVMARAMPQVGELFDLFNDALLIMEVIAKEGE